MKNYLTVRLSHLMPAQDELGSPPNCFAVSKNMARLRSRVENISIPGMFMDFYAAKQAVEDWCACVWVIDGRQVRNATPEEQQQGKMRREKAQEPLPYAELAGVKFTGTVNYSLIRAAHQLFASV